MRLVELSDRYSEVRRDGQTDDAETQMQLTTLREKIAARRAEQYQSKYLQPLAEAQARMDALAAQYNRDAASFQALKAGVPCPVCRRPVTEEELPQIQDELRNSAAALFEAIYIADFIHFAGVMLPRNSRGEHPYRSRNRR